MGMKKRIAAVLMGFMLMGSVSEAVYGAESLIPIETVVTEVTEIEKESEVSEDTDESIAAEQQESEIVEESADISAEILQEGGLLKHEDISTFEKVEGYQTFSLDTATYDKVEEAVLEALDNFSERCNLSAYNIPTSQIKDVFGEILNTNPRYFYVSGQFGYMPNTSGMVEELIIGYTYNKDESAPMLKKYDAAINTALSGVSPSWSVMEKALYLNDYLARNCAYDTTFASDHMYSSYGALVNKVAVCQGYALAYLELANALGIPCEVVTSDSLNHAWNMIQLNGNYYQLDVTWNDPEYDLLGYAGHQYFLKSTNYFKSADAKHMATADWEVTGGWQESYATDTSYDAAVWNNCDRGFDYINGYWYSFDQVSDCITKYSCNGKNMVEVAEVKLIEDYWYVWGNNRYFYEDRFVGTGAFDGKYYYSTPNAIYELDLNTFASNCVYELPDEQKAVGYIYGMTVEPTGVMKYFLAQQSCGAGTIYQATTLTKNETVANTYQVAFSSNGGTGNTMNNLSGCEFNHYYKIPECTYTRKGYEFAGWNTKKDGSGTAYADNAIIANLTNQNGATITLYAQWKKTKYKITYNLDGGTNSSKNPSKYYITTSNITLKNPSKKGYSFKGWYSDKKFKNKVTQIKKGSTGDVTLYAKWSANKYTIKFNGNGSTSGKMKNMTSCKYGTSYQLKKNSYKKKGYTFAGWNTKKDGSGKSYDNKEKVKKLTSKNGGSVTLYAQWKKTKYSIAYHLNGGTNSSKNPSKYYVTTSTIKLKNPTKKGYKFVGWYSDSKYKKKVTQIKKGSTGNIKLYAKWKKK